MPRIAIAQIRPTKGEYAANLQRIGGVLAQLAKLEPAVDLVVFPETATSGYFVEGGVRDVAVTAGTPFRRLRGQDRGGRKRTRLKTTPQQKTDGLLFFSKKKKKNRNTTS